MKTTLTFILLGICSLAKAQDCSIMQSGNFSFDDPNIANTITIAGSTITEYFSNGTVVSTLTWNNPCSYTAIVQSFDVPDFVYAVGDQMVVTIDEVTGNEISITASINGDSWNSVLLKE